jgi:transposase
VQRKLISQDPQRPAILARLRWIFKHLPTGGHLILFDIKPVAVKAYGGRCYTTAKCLTLVRNQKTRGRFYLFTSYDVVDSKAHWMFLPGKNSAYVSRFMRQLRRWYSDGDLWVALDQDRAHPCKSRATRQVMRELHLHWVSLPKGSPDDNPVENIFSDIQLLILDNSNDPDTKTTQQRISAHLRGRNRRSDRFIHISYLLAKHFHSN